MLPILLAAIDVSKTATELEARPFPYFLAITFSVVGVLWGSLVTVALWGAKGRLDQALQRATELKAERDRERAEADRITTQHIAGLVKLTNAAEALAEVKRSYDGERLQLVEERSRLADERAALGAEKRSRKATQEKPP